MQRGSNTEHNKIGVEGCLNLSKAHWINLRAIDLCKGIEYSDGNKIGAEGCKYLSKTHWPNLKTINLGKG